MPNARQAAWRARGGAVRERGDVGDALRSLAAVVDALARADVAEVPDDELEASLAALENRTRQLHAVACRWAAEAAGRLERRGRSPGSAATALASRLGVPVGELRGRVEAGGRIEAGVRAGGGAGAAHACGEITAGQERAIASWLAEVPESVPPGVRGELEAELLAAARRGTGVRALGVIAARALAGADPTWLDRREERQARRRALRMAPEGPDGASLVSVTCDAPMRMLLDAVVARFGAPGQCVAAPVDPLTGEEADPTSVASEDRRSAEQRAHDALAHVIRLGLEAGPGSARGVATVVVRLTADQLDAVEAGGRGEIVGAGPSGGFAVTDAGSPVSVRQALAASTGRSWFLSALRDGREELRRVDVDGDGGSGRGTGRRLATRLQRLVLYAAGTGGCTHPGCGQAAARCQAHHVVEYARGGPTTVANMALVCPTHHGWIGSGPDRWRTVVDRARPGTPRWIPPAGGSVGRAA